VFNRHDPHETQDEQTPPSLHDGMAVWTVDGERIGTIRGSAAQNGYLCIHQGRLFGHDVYLPEDLVGSIDGTGAYVRVRSQDLQPYLRSALPEAAAGPQASSSPSTDADTVVGSAQPVMPAPPIPALHRTAPIYPLGHPLEHPPTAHLSEPDEPHATDAPPPATLAGETTAQALEEAVLAAGTTADQLGQSANQTASQTADEVRSTVDQAQQQQQADQTTEQTRDQLGQTASQAQDQARSSIERAQQQVGQVAEHVREHVAQEAATQIGNASKGLEDLATTLTQLSARLATSTNWRSLPTGWLRTSTPWQRACKR
jgi:hypothetical protein